MDVLYHYCSTDTFHAIVSKSCVRLSALSLSNDTLEGKMVSEVTCRLSSDQRFLENGGLGVG